MTENGLENPEREALAIAAERGVTLQRDDYETPKTAAMLEYDRR